MSANGLVRDDVRIRPSDDTVFCLDAGKFNRTLVDGKYSRKRNIEFFVLDDNESDFALADLHDFSPRFSLVSEYILQKCEREVKDF